MNYETIHENLCQNLYILRKANRLTQAEMAKIIGISPGRLSGIEKYDPRVNLTCRHLYRLCTYFHFQPNDILLQNWAQMLAAGNTEILFLSKK